MPSRSSLIVAAGLLAGEASALLAAPCCASRMAASRLAVPTPRFAAVCMCDAEPAAPAEEVAEAAAPVAEAAAPTEVAPTEPAAAPKKRGGNKTPLEELVVGAEVEGKIRSVMAYGAFVDIGASTDGLVHVSEIANEFIKDANDKLTAGDAFKGRIKSINLEKGQLALSSKDPNAAPAPRGGGGGRSKVDLTEYESADMKVFVTGKVNSITDFGAFVTLKDGVDGLVHISQVQEGGVGKVSDVLETGQEVQVRVVQCDAAKRRIGLSMLPYQDGDEERKAKGGGRQGGRGGGGGSAGFGDEDLPFKMNDEELATLNAGDEFVGSPFDSAFDRAAAVQKAKVAKERYAPQVL